LDEALSDTAPTGGGVGVPAGIGTTGIPGEGDESPREEGGGPSGAREGGAGSAPGAAERENCGGPDAVAACPVGMTGGGGSVEAGVACAGAQCDVEGGGTLVPAVTSGSAEIGGADVVTEGGGGGIENGDDGGGADRECADDGGGGTERECAGGGGTDRDGGGGTEPALRPGGGGTLRPGGGAEVPGLAEKGPFETLRGRVSDSKMSSASTTEGRDAPFADAARSGVAVGSDGAPSIHSANSLDSRPCLAASMKRISLS
jgi:hypothetical protein